MIIHVQSFVYHQYTSCVLQDEKQTIEKSSEKSYSNKSDLLPG